jgi:hypothetical protein
VVTEVGTCPVPGCEADGTGTAFGGAPMLCGAYGAARPEGPCLAEWLFFDPEDRPPFPVWMPREEASPTPARPRVQPRRTSRAQRRGGAR